MIYIAYVHVRNVNKYPFIFKRKFARKFLVECGIKLGLGSNKKSLAEGF